MLNKNEAKALIELLTKAGKDVEVASGYIIVSDDLMEEGMAIDIQHLTDFQHKILKEK